MINKDKDHDDNSYYINQNSEEMRENLIRDSV